MDLEASKEVTDESLQLTFKGLLAPLVEVLESQCIRTFKANKTLIASKVAHLQQKGIIIYLLEYNPARDVIDNWVDTKLVRDLRVTIKQVKVIARFTYLAVLESHEDQQKVLAATPFQIN